MMSEHVTAKKLFVLRTQISRYQSAHSHRQTGCG